MKFILSALFISTTALANTMTLECQSIKHPATLKVQTSSQSFLTDELFTLELNAEISRQGNRQNYYHHLKKAELNVSINFNGNHSSERLDIGQQRLVEKAGRYYGKYQIDAKASTQNLGIIRFSKIHFEDKGEVLYARFDFAIEDYLRNYLARPDIKVSVQDLSVQMSCTKVIK